VIGHAPRRHPPHLRAVLTAVHDAGFEPTIRRNGHFVVQWRDSNGRRHTVTVSVTTVSRNAELEALADVRRALRPMEARP
jgi:hypothetical protein